MAFQVITGPEKVDKQSVIIQKLLHIKKDNPQAKIFYLVPDHNKFDMEARLLDLIRQIKGLNAAAITDTQVTSFKRLNWYLIPKKKLNHKSLSEIGLSMVLQASLIEIQGDLLAYQGQIYQQGFLDKLMKQFQELHEANIKPEEFKLAIDKLAEKSPKHKKTELRRLYELAKIYQHFMNKLEKGNFYNYRDFDDLLVNLASGLGLEDIYLVIDYYQHLNAQELELVVQLSQHFKHVWLNLPIKHAEARNQTWSPLDQVAKRTYGQIKRLMQNNNIEVFADWDINQPSRDYQKDILDLADYMRRVLNQENVIQEGHTSYHHECWSHDSIQTEIRQVTDRINYLVKEKGYRYKDFIIKTRQLDRYQALVEPFFSANQIPVFFDNVTEMANHPLVHFIDNLFQLKKTNWQHNKLMTMLKSSFFCLTYLEDTKEAQYQKDLLENIVLANGYQSYRFYQEEFIWNFPESQQVYQNYLGQYQDQTLGQVMDRLRTYIIKQLGGQDLGWSRKMTGSQACQWFYQLLNRLGIRDRLIQRRDQEIEAGNLEASRQDEQVWQVLMQTLDEAYSIFKNQEISFDNFSNILIAGFKKASFHIIPPSLDQVTFTSIESNQVKDYKIAFIIGMDDRVLPISRKNDTFLNNDQRESLSDNLLAHQQLQNWSSNQYSQELYLTYRIFLSATDYIYLSYYQTDNQQVRNLSSYLAIAQKAYQLKTYQFNSHDIKLNQKVQHLGQPITVIPKLIYQTRKLYEEGQLLDQELISMIQTSLQGLANPDRYFMANIFKAILVFNQLPSHLSPETAQKLFGKHLIASVSKIETYYQDPFAFFINYGLRLEERKTYEISPLQAGDYYHEFLDQLVQVTIQQALKLNDLSRKDLEKLYQTILKEIQADNRFNIFVSQARNRYIQGLLDKQMWRSLLNLQNQEVLINMEAKHTEAIFGFKQDSLLRTPTYPLSSGGSLSLTGKIDRIDSNDDLKVFQIIDYKTGKKDFNLTDVYYGLDLQILTYLQVVQATYSDYQALGTFYQPVISQFQAGEEVDLNQLNLEDTLEYKGLVLQEASVLGQIDKQLLENNQSKLYPVKLKKDGNYYSQSSYLNPQESKIILDYLMALYINAGNQIHSGQIALRPIYGNPYNQSLQSQYRVLTGFDPTSHFKLYRHKQIKKNQVLKQMQLDLEKGEIHV